MITIENEQNKVEISEKITDIIEAAIVLFMHKEHLEQDYEVSVIIIDDDGIREINREHRNIDKSTDVLSFPLVEFKDGELISDEGDYDMDEELLFLGDIIISAETAMRQSLEYGHSFEREIAFLTAHSCYHLLGYDHMTKEEEEVMINKQEDVLSEMGLKRY